MPVRYLPTCTPQVRSESSTQPQPLVLTHGRRPLVFSSEAPCALPIAPDAPARPAYHLPHDVPVHAPAKRPLEELAAQIKQLREMLPVTSSDRGKLTMVEQRLDAILRRNVKGPAPDHRKLREELVRELRSLHDIRSAVLRGKNQKENTHRLIELKPQGGSPGYVKLLRFVVPETGPTSGQPSLKIRWRDGSHNGPGWSIGGNYQTLDSAHYSVWRQQGRGSATYVVGLKSGFEPASLTLQIRCQSGTRAYDIQAGTLLPGHARAHCLPTSRELVAQILAMHQLTPAPSKAQPPGAMQTKVPVVPERTTPAAPSGAKPASPPPIILRPVHPALTVPRPPDAPQRKPSVASAAETAPPNQVQQRETALQKQVGDLEAELQIYKGALRKSPAAEPLFDVAIGKLRSLKRLQEDGKEIYVPGCRDDVTRAEILRVYLRKNERTQQLEWRPEMTKEIVARYRDNSDWVIQLAPSPTLPLFRPVNAHFRASRLTIWEREFRGRSKWTRREISLDQLEQDYPEFYQREFEGKERTWSAALDTIKALAASLNKLR